MTPELKTACEVIFQEHKVRPIKWNKDTFRGQISIGLSEMAKTTLIKKNIILLPNKSKKIITQLNPVLASAASFEEAEAMIKNKAQVLVTNIENDHRVHIAKQPSGFNIPHIEYSHQLLTISSESETRIAEIRWYMKPLFYYVVWPACAVIAGALVTFLIDLTYTKLFLD